MDETHVMSVQGLAMLIEAEFTRLGNYLPTDAAVDRLAEKLQEQGIDFGETGITAACIAFRCALGRRD